MTIQTIQFYLTVPICMPSIVLKIVPDLITFSFFKMTIYSKIAILSPFMMALCVSIFAAWGNNIVTLFPTSPAAAISEFPSGLHFLTHRHPIRKMFNLKED